MALTDGKVVLADVRTNFDAQTTALSPQNDSQRRDSRRTFARRTLADTDAASLRTFAWTQTDDAELNTIWLRVTDTVAGRVITLALTVDGGDTRFLTDQTVSQSVTTINGTVDSRDTASFGVPTTPIRLKKGVRYILTLTNTTAGTTTGAVSCGVVVIGNRRRK